jgi:hypothetical protein
VESVCVVVIVVVIVVAVVGVNILPVLSHMCESQGCKTQAFGGCVCCCKNYSQTATDRVQLEATVAGAHCCYHNRLHLQQNTLLLLLLLLLLGACKKNLPTSINSYCRNV